MSRDYSSITPSAKALLLTKALTTIPFMADVARIVCDHDFDQFKDGPFDELFLKRLVHFESRYLSLDSVLFASGSLNVLEISSGFSFRGLNMALNHPNIFYQDTDLPDLITQKSLLCEQLIKQEHLNLKGKLQLSALNALDQAQFEQVVDSMPAGRISIINEGLLMYLSLEEKVRMCGIIHKILKKKGGYWITADIYIKKKLYENPIPDAFNQFLDAHHVEDQKFESFEEAATFFAEQGFKLVTKATSVWHQLSSVKYVDPTMLNKWVKQSSEIGRIRETWVLKAV